MNFHKDGTQPKNGEIFVFGSNLAGRHGKGAALVAMKKYGAISGKGYGIQGQSFGIPTKDGRNGKTLSDPRQNLSKKQILGHVEQFKMIAKTYPK